MSLNPSECRINNIIGYGGEPTQIKYLDSEKIGFFHRLHHSLIFREYNSMDVFGVELTKQMLEVLGFVPYDQGKPLEHISGDMYEVTDGRVILRTHSHGVSVFTPINMPWITPDFPLQTYFINQLICLHEFQNTYFDLFKVDLDIDALGVMNKPL